MCKLTLSKLWIHAPVDARADVVDLLSTTLHDPIKCTERRNASRAGINTHSMSL